MLCICVLMLKIYQKDTCKNKLSTFIDGNASGDDIVFDFSEDPFRLIGLRVRKKFGDDWYDGVVKLYNPPFWTVEYNDGDVEDCTASELARILVSE